jgi:hypothetical protein
MTNAIVDAGHIAAGCETDAWIETPSGKFHFNAPHFDLSTDLAAAAHSLAQINRYNGHGRFPFSVATHQVLVSLLMEEVTGGDVFEGLWHDKAEYVMCDVPAPLKPMLPDWRALDKKIDLTFSQALGLPVNKSKECHAADMIALFIEAYQLMPSKGEGWYDPEGYRDRALKLRKQGWKISEIDWRQSRDIFIERHNAIKPVNIPAIEI